MRISFNKLARPFVLAMGFGISLTPAAMLMAEEQNGEQPAAKKQATEQGDVVYHYPAQSGAYLDNNQRRMAPGRGWCAPGKVPVVRERVSYWKYYPNYWSGYGPGPATPYHPMVYTPTDTAQLGFYYQHAPHWTAQPWRVPGPPHPAYWHNRYCGRCRAGNTGPFTPAHPVQYGYISGQPLQEAAPSEDNGPTPAEEVQEFRSEPQTLRLPAPINPRVAPRISLVPDAPPEI